MQRKGVVDFTTTRTSRIDRFAQMSKVEQVIEQKKREIQARLQKSGQSEIITESHSSPNNNSQTAVNQQPVKTSSDRSKSSRWSSSRDKDTYNNNGNYSNYSKQQRYQEKHSRFDQSAIPPLMSQHTTYSNPTTVSSNTLISTNYPLPYSGTLNVPPPSHIQHSTTPPIQLQNIPPPLPIRLNEIPNPKPLEIQNIPPPGQLHDKNLINTEVLKNIPPPNKSIPPPCLNPSNSTKPVDNNIVNINVSYPPPNPNSSIPIVPPPVLATQTTMPPPSAPLTTILHPQGQYSSNTLSGVTQATIPSLMSQPVLPPAGMNVCIQPQINLPPPPIVASTSTSVIPSLLTQPPPNTQITNSIPPMTVPPPNIISSTKNNSVCPIGSESYAAMSSVARMVAQCGTSFEDAVRQRSHQDPKMWFIYDKNSSAYRQYQELVNQFKAEFNQSNDNTEYKPEDLYESDNLSNTDDRSNNDSEDLKKDIRYPLKDPNEIKKEIPSSSYSYNSNFSTSIKNESQIKEESDSDSDNESSKRRKRRRKSRWGNQSTDVPPPVISLPPQVAPIKNNIVTGKDSMMLTKVTRSDPALLQYAVNTFGTANLSEEDWQKAEDHYKINLLYQDMLRKRQELERLQKAGKFKYEYDSDEEVDGGTWEHKIRMQEMEATKLWASELTKKAEGKHHIGDFLPPEELRKFLEQSTAAKEGREPDLSDYKEYKLKSDNIGFKMLQKLGWSEGQGLGVEGSGIIEPVNKASQRETNQGLGLTTGEIKGNDDEYDAYRKRMMLAYRFRPNPLNNPRRPYY
ncbi:SURP and G-patch domain-containing protein 1 isoform X2 [Chrysoperla carnea]|uniref:SURP and G-patch domain-containing protein 1 isoform X2 n=1 Tax=Chrysoperla carnea TaxID=189513 RepID=UPI001D06D20F|nr:SURP and G-patch domain-containing protein 1 isoform X2 [Chrysoperla carnea]